MIHISMNILQIVREWGRMFAVDIFCVIPFGLFVFILFFFAVCFLTIIWLYGGVCIFIYFDCKFFNLKRAARVPHSVAIFFSFIFFFHFRCILWASVEYWNAIMVLNIQKKCSSTEQFNSAVLYVYICKSGNSFTEYTQQLKHRKYILL